MKRWIKPLRLALCKPAFLCDELVFIRLLTIIITTFVNIAIKPRQAIRLMLCVFVLRRGFQPLLESRTLEGGAWGRIDWRVLRSRVFVHWSQYRDDRRTDRHSRRFQLDCSICQALLLWFHMEAGEKGSVVKHLAGESDSCRTEAWDGRRDWSVDVGLQLQADAGAKYAAAIAVVAVRIPVTSLHGCHTEPENDYGDKTWA